MCNTAEVSSYSRFFQTKIELDKSHTSALICSVLLRHFECLAILSVYLLEIRREEKRSDKLAML